MKNQIDQPKNHEFTICIENIKNLTSIGTKIEDF